MPGWRQPEPSEGGRAGLVPRASQAAEQARGSQVQPETQITAWLMDDAGPKSNCGGNVCGRVQNKQTLGCYTALFQHCSGRD